MLYLSGDLFCTDLEICFVLIWSFGFVFSGALFLYLPVALF